MNDFLKSPATKQDLIFLGIALWLADSGTGEKGLEAIQTRLRGLLGAAKEPEEAPPAHSKASK